MKEAGEHHTTGCQSRPRSASRKPSMATVTRSLQVRGPEPILYLNSLAIS